MARKTQEEKRYCNHHHERIFDEGELVDTVPCGIARVVCYVAFDKRYSVKCNDGRVYRLPPNLIRRSVDEEEYKKACKKHIMEINQRKKDPTPFLKAPIIIKAMSEARKKQLERLKQRK